jgi:anti-sigma regulatory factor (Ser/Thr protein kinase)
VRWWRVLNRRELHLAVQYGGFSLSALDDPEISGPDGPDVRLALPALAENVAVVRQAVAGLADALEIDPALCADMKIAVTEACTNAVLHAYDGDIGPLEITMEAMPGRLMLSVRDRGPGFRPLPGEADGAPLGFGLALIASLADAFAIQGGAHGTEVQMAFDLDPDSGELESDAVAPASSQLGRAPAPPPEGIVLIKARPGPLVAPVLGRVVSLLAARVDFSMDRLSDAQLVSDAIAAHASAHAVDGHVTMTVHESARSLDLRVGPLVGGGGEKLIRDTDMPGLGRLLEQLTDEIETEPVPDAETTSAEMLHVRMAQLS